VRSASRKKILSTFHDFAVRLLQPEHNGSLHSSTNCGFGPKFPTSKETIHSMIPSSKWFPTALADRAAWFQEFATNFAALAGDIGFLPADVTSVNADHATVQALTNYSF